MCQHEMLESITEDNTITTFCLECCKVVFIETLEELQEAINQLEEADK
jgi:hypothetical protein